MGGKRLSTDVFPYASTEKEILPVQDVDEQLKSEQGFLCLKVKVMVLTTESARAWIGH
jgi:hypothetical protein